MTTSPLTPAADSSGPSPEQGDAGWADMVLAGRAVSTGQWIAGLIAAAQLDTVGTPRKLPADLFAHHDVDPAVVQEIWDRAVAVGVRAGRLMGAPRFNRDKLTRLQGELEGAGFAAMGPMVGRSVRLVDPTSGRGPAQGLAVDEESAREHSRGGSGVISRTTDTYREQGDKL